jgi:putative oligomerization/nucleic acid binding protein
LTRPSPPDPSDEANDEEVTVGILKTAATVAVASSVHGRVQRRQQNRWAAQDQAAAGVPAPPPPVQYAAPAQPQHAYAEPAPPPAPAAAPAPAAPAAPADMADRLAQLKQLGELLSAGVLTQAEFEQQKARILNG